MNPQKKEKKITMTTSHRIFLVVFIPNEEGFYKNSFEVFKTCLDSIISTIDSHAAITVVNNGSINKVKDLLDKYLNEKKIDSLISHNSNIGKIDALIGAARGAREKLITLTDSDVLFVRGWQENVEEIFLAFSDVGSVSPIPVRTGLFAHTSSVLKKILFKKLKFRLMSIPNNLYNYNRFLSSINWDLEFDENKKWPVVESNGVKAIVGSPHQVLTIDRDILFTTSPSCPSLSLIGKNSVDNYIDIPIDKSGKLRLSTFNNYAFHIGNTLEDWMIDVQNQNLKPYEKKSIIIHGSEMKDLFNSKFKNKIYSLRKLVIKKIFRLIYGIR